jgi:hypothetical protein
LRRLTSTELAEWVAFYVIEESDQDPEVTRWDDEKSIRRKLARQAERKG